MSQLEEYRSQIQTAPIMISAWRQIVESEETDQYTDQGLQLFAKEPCFTGSEKTPYRIECYKLCPLTLEACNGNKTLFEQLLEPVEAVHNKELFQDVLDETIEMVIRTHRLDMIKYMLDKGSNVNAVSRLTESSIMAAICGDYYVEEDNNIKIVELLISRGADDLSGAMRGAAYNYRVQLLKYLLSVGASATGLCMRLSM